MKSMLFFLMMLVVIASCQQKHQPEEKSNGRDLIDEDRMAWWKEARFGLFIHWGLYALPAGEWDGKKVPGISEWIMLRAEIPVSDYEKLAEDFNPVGYNAEEWVLLAKRAGMKYIVITSKHHDGFALYHSKVNNYNIVDATPFDRDPLAELAEACKKHDIKLGFYHSQAQDWHHPGGAYWGMEDDRAYWDESVNRVPFMDYINEKAYPQVEEILSNYGDIAIMWWDTPVGMTEEAADKLHSLLELQPGIIENNRLYGPWDGDFSTPEQHIPPTGLDYDWEVCMTMNTSWGYKHYDDNWKSTKTLIRFLSDIASKGGNFLLNVGPTEDGIIPAPSVERLQEIGKWMGKNGEAVYGTTASPFFKLFWGRCTKKKTETGYMLYLHVFNVPENKKIIVPGLRSEVVNVTMLSDGSIVPFEDQGDDIVINIDDQSLDPYNTVIKVEIAGDLEVISNMPEENEEGVIDLPAAYSFIHNRGYGEQAALSEMAEDAHISNWVDHRTRIEYMFSVDNTGDYELLIEGATSADEIEFTITLDDQTQVVAFQGTGTLSGFSEISAGEITLKKDGIHLLTIKPVAEKWEKFRLRRVRLRSE